MAPPSDVAQASARPPTARGRTRLVLVRGAARALAEHGLRRSTMQSIAAAAGVAKGTLYNHVRTKDEVVALLLEAELDRLTDLVAGLPPEPALVILADELAGHPVLRRLAETEPDSLTALLAAPPERWAVLTARLASVLRVDDAAAELVARWLVGLVLQPGRASLRRRHAALLAAVLAPLPAAS